TATDPNGNTSEFGPNAVVTASGPLVAADDAYSTAEDTPLSVAAPGVLANDNDPDGDPLTTAFATGPAHGVLSLVADGGFTYTSAANYSGPDSFSYTTSDGQGATATAT